MNVLNTKLDAKRKRCISLGYSKKPKGYSLYDPETKNIIVSQDVVFCKQPHFVETYFFTQRNIKGNINFLWNTLTINKWTYELIATIPHDVKFEDDKMEP